MGLMSILDTMNDKLTSHGAAIAAIVNDLNSQITKPGLPANVHRPFTNQGVINNTGNTPSTRTVSDVITGDSLNDKHRMASEGCKPSDARQPSGSWADMAAAVSTPRHSHFTNASSTATDDDLNKKKSD